MDDNSAAIFYFDLETSGTNPYADHIIEIGITTQDLSKTFSVLIKPPFQITSNIEYITGITNKMLDEDGLNLHTALQSLHSFIRSNTKRGQKVWLIGHNAIGFDRIFYQRALEASKIRPMRPTIQWFDSLYLARFALPQLNSFRLISIAKYLKKADTQHHRALADCQLLASVFPILISFAIKRGNIKETVKTQVLLNTLNLLLCT